MLSLKDTNIGRIILESISGGSEKRASKSLDVSEIRKVSGSLEKVAGLPYKEEVYNSVQELVKIAASYLKESADELESSLSRQAELKRAIETRSVIDDMVHYGILDPSDIAEKVAELSSKTDQEIEIVKTAVEMIKSGKGSTLLFETEKTASAAASVKRGMFDSVQF